MERGDVPDGEVGSAFVRLDDVGAVGGGREILLPVLEPEEWPQHGLESVDVAGERELGRQRRFPASQRGLSILVGRVSRGIGGHDP